MVENVIIAGAGPVGSLMAFLLAKQGISSDVYERHEKPERTPSADNSQAYLLNANHRTITTFKENGIPLDLLVKRSGGYLEQIFLGPSGKVYHKVEAPVTLENPTMMRVFRDEIARHVIDEAQAQFPDKIKFHFGEGVSDVDLEKKQVTVSSRTGEKQVKYDFLIGADGAGSKVRAALQKISEPDFLKRRGHDTVYTTGPCQNPPGAFPKNTLFLLHSFEAGAVMVNGRGDGDVRAALFLPKFLADQVSAGDSTQVRKYVDNGLPGLNKSGREAIYKILDNPGKFHPISGWTYLNKLYGPSTLLLGDAAHTMTPMLGQGCNSGLEDARLFSEALKKNPKDLDSALKAYNALRWPDIQALLKLNEVAANERHLILTNESAFLHTLWVQSHAAMLKIHQIFGRVLQKRLPRFFGPPQIVLALMGKAQYRSVMPAVYRDTFLVSSVAILSVIGVTAGVFSLISKYKSS